MKKFFAGCLLLVLGLPLLLSFIASYYLQNNFLDNFDQEIQIKRFDYKHGWFNSNAQIDFELKSKNIVIETDNRINHGPVIWSLLISKPIQAFSLYQVNSLFEITENTALLTDSSQIINSKKGTARTVVSYTGKSSPEINHPGLALRLLNSHIFADLTDFKGEFSAQGTILANFSANQFEILDRYSSLYITQPRVEISLYPDMTLPHQVEAWASSLSGASGPDEINISEFILVSNLEKKDSRYHLSCEANADLLAINKVLVDQTTVSLQAFDVDQELITYFSAHYPEIISSLQNNHWLVLLRHFSQIMKHLNHHQPLLTLKANGLYASQPLTIEFYGKLVTDGQSQINPFSILENLEMKLDANIPTKLVDEINRSELTDFLNLMSEKGLLIRKNESYHSKLSFEGAKLKIAHDIL